MAFIRTFSRQLAGNGFRLSVLLLAVSCTLLAAFGSSQTVKDTLKGSDIYVTIANTVVKQITDEGGDGQSTGVSETLQQPEVQDAAKSSFSPAFLQSSTEQVVDGTYHWLEGTTANPDFKVDLTPAVDVFENKAADAATERVKKLPACTLVQLREINPATADPFTLTCLPAGFNVDARRQTVIDSVKGKNEFLQNPVLTADRIPKDSNGQTVFERASMAPKVFHWVKIAPWILGILTVVLAAVVILLTLPHRKGIGNLAISLIGNGILLVIISFLAGYVFNRFFNSSSSPLHMTDDSAQQSVVAVIGAFSGIIRHSLLLFGAVYAVIGALTLATLRLTRRPDPTGPLEERRSVARNDKPKTDSQPSGSNNIQV